MEGGPAYVLGIDGLPMGTAAAVAVDGAIHSILTVPGPGARAGGVNQRIRDAVAGAEAALGAPPVEVRLVLVDDGADGTEAAQAGQWLASRGIRFHLLDLVGPDGVAPLSSHDPEAQRARSVARATEAALW